MKRTFFALVFLSIAVAAFGQCPRVTDLTAYFNYASAHVWLHYTAPMQSTYYVYSTTQTNPDPMPGPAWVLEGTFDSEAGVTVEWTDVLPAVNYKVYMVTYDCNDFAPPISNLVAYKKLQCNGAPNTTVYTSFGLPFKFWFVPAGEVPQYGTERRKPWDIIGTQSGCGTLSTADRIVRQDNGHFGYRGNACSWYGTLQTNPSDMEPGRAYWYANKSGVLRNVILAGDADTTAVGIPTVTIAAPVIPGGSMPTPYSWRDPRTVPRNKLNLVEQGFSNQDRVMAQVGGAAFYYRSSDNTWQGSLLAVAPGQAYWIINRNVGHVWDYTYNASGVPITMPGERPAR